MAWGAGREAWVRWVPVLQRAARARAVRRDRRPGLRQRKFETSSPLRERRGQLGRPAVAGLRRSPRVRLVGLAGSAFGPRPSPPLRPWIAGTRSAVAPVSLVSRWECSARPVWLAWRPQVSRDSTAGWTACRCSGLMARWERLEHWAFQGSRARRGTPALLVGGRLRRLARLAVLMVTANLSLQVSPLEARGSTPEC